MANQELDYPGLTETEVKWVVGITGLTFFLFARAVSALLVRRGLMTDTALVASGVAGIGILVGMAVGYVFAMFSVAMPKQRWYAFYFVFVAGSAASIGWWFLR